MIKIAVCDDDPTSLKQIIQYVKEYQNINCSIYSYDSGIALLEDNVSFDIILLDIDMPQLNGLETAKRIRERDKDVILIYITNYSDYSVFAFAVHAFSYLLKPVDKEALYHQLAEALEYKKPLNSSELEFITLNGILRLKPEQILYFEYLNRKIYLHTKEEIFSLKGKISSLHDELLSYGFDMPHKSFLVNLFAIKSIKGNDIFLVNEELLPLSQKKAADFKKALNYYLSTTRRTILS